jgi:hypothetical protein
MERFLNALPTPSKIRVKEGDGSTYWLNSNLLGIIREK